MDTTRATGACCNLPAATLPHAELALASQTATRHGSNAVLAPACFLAATESALASQTAGSTRHGSGADVDRVLGVLAAELGGLVEGALRPAERCAVIEALLYLQAGGGRRRWLWGWRRGRELRLWAAGRMAGAPAYLPARAEPTPRCRGSCSFTLPSVHALPYTAVPLPDMQAAGYATNFTPAKLVQAGGGGGAAWTGGMQDALLTGG